jgi:hypothetical protein
MKAIQVAAICLLVVVASGSSWNITNPAASPLPTYTTVANISASGTAGASGAGFQLELIRNWNSGLEAVDGATSGTSTMGGSPTWSATLSPVVSWGPTGSDTHYLVLFAAGGGGWEHAVGIEIVDP